jgi:hypothetical protein
LTEEEKKMLDDNHAIVEINDSDQQESNINMINVHLSGLVSINVKIEKDNNSDDRTDRRKSSASVKNFNVLEKSKTLGQKNYNLINKDSITEDQLKLDGYESMDKTHKLLIGLYNLLFKPENAKITTILHKKTYNTNDDERSQKNVLLTIANIERNKFDQIMSQNDKFREFIYKKALMDLIELNIQ